MTSATGLGMVDIAILEACERSGAVCDAAHLNTQRVLEMLHEQTGFGPRVAYEPLLDLARPSSVHLPLIDFHGNYGSPDFGPAAPRYTECRLTPLGQAAPPISDINDASAGGITELVVTVAQDADAVAARRFLDTIWGVRRTMTVCLGRPVATLVREFIERSPGDLEHRLTLIEAAIRR